MIAKNHASSSNFNARRYGVTEQITETDILDLFEEETACKICGSSDDLTVDHIIPLAGHGPNTRVNLQILCKPCNSKKNSKMPDGSRAYRPKQACHLRYVCISMRLDEEKKMLEELAEKEDRNMSAIVRRLIREEWKKCALKELRKK